MAELLYGKVQGGQGNAAHWLKLFNDAYRRKLGTLVFPGSLNLRLSCDFDWAAPRYRDLLIRFPQEEYGGERDILLLPCVLMNLEHHPAFLWTTTTPVAADERRVVELLAFVKLRDAFNLKEGDTVVIRIGVTLDY